jgi:hypothetical protein
MDDGAARRCVAWAALVLALALVVACGSTSDQSEDAGSGPGSTTTAPTSSSTSTTTGDRCDAAPRPTLMESYGGQGCPDGDDEDEPDDEGPARTTSTSTTTTSTSTTTTRPRTTTTAGSPCTQYRDTQYVPSQSWVTFERNGVQVSVHGVPSKTLTVVVTSSDGQYDETQVDPTTTLYEGLEITSKIGFGWVWDYALERFVLKGGQVSRVLRVYDCWTWVEGPDDLF